MRWLENLVSEIIETVMFCDSRPPRSRNIESIISSDITNSPESFYFEILKDVKWRRSTQNNNQLLSMILFTIKIYQFHSLDSVTITRKPKKSIYIDNFRVMKYENVVDRYVWQWFPKLYSLVYNGQVLYVEYENVAVILLHYTRACVLQRMYREKIQQISPLEDYDIKTIKSSVQVRKFFFFSIFH